MMVKRSVLLNERVTATNTSQFGKLGKKGIKPFE
jgi:hypothetical protein